MVNKCSVGGCKTNYVGHGTDAVFSFPKDPDLFGRWKRFCNRLNWEPTDQSRIWHFEAEGKNDNRWRLIKTLKPVPTIYIKHDSSLSDSSQGPSTSTSSVVDTMISPSIMPTISIPRKSPKKRLFREDEFSKFLDKDLIKDFSCVNESMCPAGYSCTKYDDHVVYYKMEISEKSIPCVTETIRVDNLLHVQLSLRVYRYRFHNGFVMGETAH